MSTYHSEERIRAAALYEAAPEDISAEISTMDELQARRSIFRGMIFGAPIALGLWALIFWALR